MTKAIPYLDDNLDNDFLAILLTPSPSVPASLRGAMIWNLSSRSALPRYERGEERLDQRKDAFPALRHADGHDDLKSTRLRNGSYFPSFMEPNTRSERRRSIALCSRRHIISGVSTRKIPQARGGAGITSIL